MLSDNDVNHIRHLIIQIFADLKLGSGVKVNSITHNVYLTVQLPKRAGEVKLSGRAWMTWSEPNGSFEQICEALQVHASPDWSNDRLGEDYTLRCQFRVRGAKGNPKFRVVHHVMK